MIDQFPNFRVSFQTSSETKKLVSWFFWWALTHMLPVVSGLFQGSFAVSTVSGI